MVRGRVGWLTGCENAEIVSLRGKTKEFILLFFDWNSTNSPLVASHC